MGAYYQPLKQPHIYTQVVSYPFKELILAIQNVNKVEVSNITYIHGCWVRSRGVEMAAETSGLE